MQKIAVLSFALIIVFSCKAQNTTLNDTELFDGIRFNNVPLGALMKTGGDLTKMQALFGNQIKEKPNNTGPFLGKELYNDNIIFSFEDETDTGNDYYLTYIRVINSSVVVQVKGLNIQIGDDKSKFGSMLMNPKSGSYNFIDEETGSASLSFEIDPSTNKVTGIKFILF